MNPFSYSHVAITTLLAALVWMLYRRQYSLRRRLTALESELGLVKKRFEAATAGLHIRVLTVEKYARQGRAVTPSAAGAAAVGSRRLPAGGPAEPPPPAALSPGEQDLWRKLRRLGRNQAIP